MTKTLVYAYVMDSSGIFVKIEDDGFLCVKKVKTQSLAIGYIEDFSDYAIPEH